MKTLILLALLTGCATTGTHRLNSKPVQKMEFSLRQNLIIFAITVVGAGLQGLGYYLATKKMGEDIGNRMEGFKGFSVTIPMPPIP